MVERKKPVKKDAVNFTKDWVKNVTVPTAGRMEYRDEKAQGLYLRVTARGVKTFCFIGRPKGSTRTERLTIGKFPVVTVEVARDQAKKIAGTLVSGDSMAAAARNLRGEMTVNELGTAYLAHLRVHSRRPKQFEDKLRLYIGP